MNEPLSQIERRVYHYLLDFLSTNTYQPSVREIGRRFRIKSTKTVAEILHSLAEKGFIEREAGRSRGVHLLGFESMGQVQPVPLYSRINPSAPHLTAENRERFVAVDRSFVPSDDAFFLRNAGDAMLGLALCDGDWVLVSPSRRARDGDLIAVRVGGDVLVRTVARMGAVLSLSPASAEVREVLLGPGDDFAVLGVVAAVFRPFHDAVPADEDASTP